MNRSPSRHETPTCARKSASTAWPHAKPGTPIARSAGRGRSGSRRRSGMRLLDLFCWAGGGIDVMPYYGIMCTHGTQNNHSRLFRLRKRASCSLAKWQAAKRAMPPVRGASLVGFHGEIMAVPRSPSAMERRTACHAWWIRVSSGSVGFTISLHGRQARTCLRASLSDGQKTWAPSVTN